MRLEEDDYIIYNSMFMEKKLRFKVWQAGYFTYAKNLMPSKVHCLIKEILHLKDIQVPRSLYCPLSLRNRLYLFLYLLFLQSGTTAYLLLFGKDHFKKPGSDGEETDGLY